MRNLSVINITLWSLDYIILIYLICNMCGNHISMWINTHIYTIYSWPHIVWSVNDITAAGEKWPAMTIPKWPINCHQSLTHEYPMSITYRNSREWPDSHTIHRYGQCPHQNTTLSESDIAPQPVLLWRLATTDVFVVLLLNTVVDENQFKIKVTVYLTFIDHVTLTTWMKLFLSRQTYTLIHEHDCYLFLTYQGHQTLHVTTRQQKTLQIHSI